MADLIVDYTKVREVEVIEQFTGPTDDMTINPGEYARLDPTSGNLTKGNATTAAEVGTGGGIVITRQANTITIVKKGIIWLGDALASLNFGDTVYLSNTDGTLADAAGTVSKAVGTVVPLYGHTPFQKGLRVEL